jgi:hypothetical protein
MLLTQSERQFENNRQSVISPKFRNNNNNNKTWKLKTESVLLKYFQTLRYNM